MTYSKTVRGKRGTSNQRTMHRRSKMAEAVKDLPLMGVPIVELNMLQRIRYASDFYFVHAEDERKKGDRADVPFMIAMIERGAHWASQAAPYVRPRLAAMQFDREPQRHSLDLTKLTDDELKVLDRIYTKSQTLVRDESPPRTADEYLPPTKPIIADENTSDRPKSVDEPDRPTNDEADSER